MSVIDWPSAVVVLQERLARAEKVIAHARLISAACNEHSSYEDFTTALNVLRAGLSEYDRPSALSTGETPMDDRPKCIIDAEVADLLGVSIEAIRQMTLAEFVLAALDRGCDLSLKCGKVGPGTGKLTIRVERDGRENAAG